MLSNKPEGYLDDNLPPSKERVGTVKPHWAALFSVLNEFSAVNNPPLWLFSLKPKNVPEIYKNWTSDPCSYLRSFCEYLVLWFPLWQWLRIFFSFPVIWVIDSCDPPFLNLILCFLFTG